MTRPHSPSPAGPDRRPLAPLTTVLLALLALGLAACGEPQAWGEGNSLIVVMPDSLWAEVEDSTYAVLEPTIFTTREEKRFVVTQVPPETEDLGHFLQFRQVVVAGTPDDELVRDVAEEAEQTRLEPSSVIQAVDVWARGQIATAVVLDPDAPARSWLSQLPATLAMIDATYRDWVRQRMFVTGPDTMLADSLARAYGFRIRVPRVYDEAVRGDSLLILRNDNPDPSQLIRQLTVAWREPPLDSLTAQAAYEWRARVDATEYNVPQEIDTTRASTRSLEVDGRPGLEATGVWSDEEGSYPAAGPFIVWLVQCPERTFFLDAWLYAPNDPKYEYMLQLRELLQSFECAGEAADEGA